MKEKTVHRYEGGIDFQAGGAAKDRLARDLGAKNDRAAGPAAFLHDDIGITPVALGEDYRITGLGTIEGRL